VPLWSELKLPTHACGCGGFASPILLPESGVMGMGMGMGHGAEGRDLCRIVLLSRD
jgi:hypothetical protein